MHNDIEELVRDIGYISATMSFNMDTINLFWDCLLFSVSAEDDNYLPKVLTTSEPPITKHGNHGFSYV